MPKEIDWDSVLIAILLAFVACFLAWVNHYDQAVIAAVVALGSALKGLVKTR